MSIFKGGLEEDCPFCEKIINEDCELSSDEIVAYFEPLNPVVDGHLVFIPTAHVEHRTRFGLGTTSIGQVIYTAHEYGVKQESDFNLITSCGSSATQTIKHIHVHYIPRINDDGLKLPWTGQVKSNT